MPAPSRQEEEPHPRLLVRCSKPRVGLRHEHLPGFDADVSDFLEYYSVPTPKARSSWITEWATGLWTKLASIITQAVHRQQNVLFYGTARASAAAAACFLHLASGMNAMGVAQGIDARQQGPPTLTMSLTESTSRLGPSSSLWPARPLMTLVQARVRPLQGPVSPLLLGAQPKSRPGMGASRYQ